MMAFWTWLLAAFTLLAASSGAGPSLVRELQQWDDVRPPALVLLTSPHPCTTCDLAFREFEAAVRALPHRPPSTLQLARLTVQNAPNSSRSLFAHVAGSAEAGRLPEPTFVAMGPRQVLWTLDGLQAATALSSLLDALPDEASTLPPPPPPPPQSSAATVHVVRSEQALRELEDEHELVVLALLGGDADGQASWHGVLAHAAASWSNRSDDGTTVAFASTDADDLADALKAKLLVDEPFDEVEQWRRDPPLLVLNSFEGFAFALPPFAAPLHSEAVVRTVVAAVEETATWRSKAAAMTFTSHTANEVIRSAHLTHVLAFFPADTDELADAPAAEVQAFRRWARRRHRDALFVQVPCSGAASRDQAVQSVRSFMDVQDDARLPALAILDRHRSVARKYQFPADASWSDSELDAFFANFASGGLPPSIKSGPVPNPDTQRAAKVKELVVDNWEAETAGKDVLLALTAPWCRTCLQQNSRAVVEQVAEVVLSRGGANLRPRPVIVGWMDLGRNDADLLFEPFNTSTTSLPFRYTMPLLLLLGDASASGEDAPRRVDVPWNDGRSVLPLSVDRTIGVLEAHTALPQQTEVEVDVGGN